MSSPSTSEEQTEDLNDGTGPYLGSGGRLKRLMLLLLWAPTAWIVFFWAVYLVTEVACADQPVGASIGDATLIAFVTVATIAALVGVAAVLPWSRSSVTGAGGDRGLRLTVILIVACFALAVVAVGLPALVLDPC